MRVLRFIILIAMALILMCCHSAAHGQSTSASQITWPVPGAGYAPNATGNPMVTTPAWIPVDQAVGDQDRLSTSFRQISPGLDPYGQHTSMFRVVPDASWSPITSGNASPLSPTYYRISPGVRARVDRIDYIIQTGKRDYEMNIGPKVDGYFLEYPSLNTVYDLRPIPLGVPTSVSPGGNALSDGLPNNRVKNRAVSSQINGQINGDINGQVDGRVK